MSTDAAGAGRKKEFAAAPQETQNVNDNCNGLLIIGHLYSVKLHQ